MPSTPAVRIRPVRDDDLDAMLALAQAAGPGFTNLPPDRKAIADRIARSIALLSGEKLGGAIILGLEVDGRVRGCGMVFPRLGVDWLKNVTLHTIGWRFWRRDTKRS